MSLIDKIKDGNLGDVKVGSDGVPKFNVTMLGGSGSGKTVYMHALFQLLRYGNLEGHNIRGDGENHQEQLKRDAEIADFTWTKAMRQSRGKLIFPEGTADTQEWTFCLTYKEEVICRFNWIDYRGGMVADLSSDDPDVVSLRDLLAESDGLLLFIDSPSLFYYEGDIDRKEESGIQDLDEVIGSFALQSKGARKKAVSIVLSKMDSDLLDDNIARPGDIKGGADGGIIHKDYAGLIQAYLENGRHLNEILLNVGWKSAITPVGALGRGRTVTTLHAPDADSSLEDSVYVPSNPGDVPVGNKRGECFNGFNPPAQSVEFKPVSSGDRFPRPENTFSPLLWVLDSLLLDANGGYSNVSEKQRGLFKNMMRSFRKHTPEDEAETDSGPATTTEAAVKSSTIVPLAELYPNGIR